MKRNRGLGVISVIIWLLKHFTFHLKYRTEQRSRPILHACFPLIILTGLILSTTDMLFRIDREPSPGFPTASSFLSLHHSHP